MRKLIILLMALMGCFALVSCDISSIIGAGGGFAGGDLGGDGLGDGGELGGNGGSGGEGSGEDEGEDSVVMGGIGGSGNNSEDAVYLSKEDFVGLFDSINYSMRLSESHVTGRDPEGKVAQYIYIGEKTLKLAQDVIYVNELLGYYDEAEDFGVLKYDERDEHYITYEDGGAYIITVDSFDDVVFNYEVRDYDEELAWTPLSSYLEGIDLEALYDKMQIICPKNSYYMGVPDSESGIYYSIYITFKDGKIEELKIEKDDKSGTFLQYVFSDIDATELDMSKDIIGNAEDSVVTEAQWQAAMAATNYTAEVFNREIYYDPNGNGYSFSPSDYALMAAGDKLYNSFGSYYYALLSIESFGFVGEGSEWAKIVDSGLGVGYVASSVGLGEPDFESVAELLFKHHSMVKLIFDEIAVSFSDLTFDPLCNMYEYSLGSLSISMKFNKGVIEKFVYEYVGDDGTVYKMLVNFKDVGNTSVELPEYIMERDIVNTVTYEQFVANMMRDNYCLEINGKRNDVDEFYRYGIEVCDTRLQVWSGIGEDDTSNDYALVDGKVYRVVFNTSNGNYELALDESVSIPTCMGEHLFVIDTGASYEEIYGSLSFVEGDFFDVYEYHFEKAGASDAWYEFYFENGSLVSMELNIEYPDGDYDCYMYMFSSYGSVTEDDFAPLPAEDDQQ